MLPGNTSTTDALALRPARDSDAGFLEELHRTTRDDLLQIDGEQDMIEGIIEMQRRAQNEGYGARFPNAMQLIVEKHGERIGRAVIDFGENEVRVIDIAFIRAARGKGFGTIIMRQFQAAATQVRAPLTIAVLRENVNALRFYAALGFSPESQDTLRLYLVWHPATLACAS